VRKPGTSKRGKKKATPGMSATPALRVARHEKEKIGDTGWGIRISPARLKRGEKRKNGRRRGVQEERSARLKRQSLEIYLDVQEVAQSPGKWFSSQKTGKRVFGYAVGCCAVKSRDPLSQKSRPAALVPPLASRGQRWEQIKLGNG